GQVSLAFRLRSDPAPIRERAGVQDVAFEGPGGFPPRPNRKELSDIAGDRKQTPVRNGAQTRDLSRGEGYQARGGMIGIQAVDIAVVARAYDRFAGGIESEGIDEVFRVAPNLARLAVGQNAVNFGAADDILRGRCRRRGGGGTRLGCHSD